MRLLDKLFQPPSDNDDDLIKRGLWEAKEEIKGREKVILAGGVIGFILGLFISGYFMQQWNRLIGEIDTISLIKCPVYAVTSVPGWLMLLIITYICFYEAYLFVRKNFSTSYYDKYSKGFVAKENYGMENAHWQTFEERKKNFMLSKDPLKLKGNILGKDEDGWYYSLNDKIVGVNKNKAVFGIPGSGKSASIIENDIMSVVQRRESGIVTDSKGDIYRKTAKKVREAGYVVKVLNVKNTELRNSDGFNLLKYLENGDVSVAEILSRCIIENTGDGKYGYWPDNEKNLYLAIMLKVATDPVLKKTGENTLAKVYEIVTLNTPQTLATLFGGIPDTHPAKQCYRIFANAEPKNQGQILNGMGIRMNFLINEDAKAIVSNDEIDLVLPMIKPCMYYVIIPDTNKAYNVIANMFFNMMLIKQCEYSDSLPEKIRTEKQLPVNYILDEFKATGSINNFDQTITTVRSRKLAFTIVLQAKSQLEAMYPDAYDTILGAMTLKILLQGGDEVTAKYFSDMCGNQTRVFKGKRYDEYAHELVKSRTKKMVNESTSTGPLLTVAAAQQLTPDEQVICMIGQQPIRLLKYLSFTNPLLQNCEELLPNRHLPRWRAIKEGKYIPKNNQNKNINNQNNYHSGNNNTQNSQSANTQNINNTDNNMNQTPDNINPTAYNADKKMLVETKDKLFS